MASRDALVVVDPAELRRFKQELDRFDKGLTTGLRREWKIVGQEGVDAVVEKLREPSPDRGPNTGANRDILIAGTKTTVSFGVRSAGVKITTSGSKLPKEHEDFLTTFNKKTILHPVFGRDVWVAQKGNPFFAAAIEPAMDRDALERLSQALDTALAAMGAKAL